MDANFDVLHMDEHIIVVRWIPSAVHGLWNGHGHWAPRFARVAALEGTGSEGAGVVVRLAAGL